MPANFTTLSVVLKSAKNNGIVCSLVNILGSLEMKVPCFFLARYNEAIAKEIALQIMASDLKKKKLPINTRLLLIK